MTTRFERIKMQRRMQRRIQLVVEERRMAAARPRTPRGRAIDDDKTIELTPRAIGRVAVPR